MDDRAALGGAAHDGDVRVASFAQRRMWFLDRLDPGACDYLLPLALRIRGELDTDALQAALLGIAARHEVLRTRFVAVDGEPVPRVDPVETLRLDRTSARDAAELLDRELHRPIDLATEPPLRMTLAELAPGEHLLLLVVHHIAIDGWSWQVLMRELAAGYRGEPVAAPALSYADVAARERRLLSDERLARQLTWWRERLTGLEPLALPTDRPRPAFWDGSGDVVRFSLPAELVAEASRYARARRATPFMVLLATYQALLARYSGRTDIAVCTTIADRGRTDVAGLIGPFVNTLVLRNDLSGGPSFDALVDRVRESTLGALSHAATPFDRVVGEVAGERDLSRHPLCQASFTMLDAAGQRVELPGLECESVHTPLTGSPMDVFLDLNLMGDGRLQGTLQYATALFDRDAMERFRDGYERLLRAVLADPGSPVERAADALEPLPGRERRRLLELAAGPGAQAGPAAPVALRGAPDDVALVCAERSFTYGELDGLAGGLAVLLESRGVRSGSVVGVCVGRGVWSVAAMLAVWRCGAVYVPMDAGFPAERLAYMVAEAAVGWVVADAGTEAVAEALGARIARVEDVRPRRDLPAATVAPGDLAYVIFTSGSSGRPKAVGVEHGALARHVAAMREAFGVTAADRVLAFASFTFDASLDQLLPALTSGAGVVVRPDEQWLPSRIPSYVERFGVTVLNLPPTYWAESAASLAASGAQVAAGLRLLVLGGEAVPAGALAAWRAAAPHVTVINAYGPTEAVVSATLHTVGGDAVETVPIGRPAGARRVYVLDARGEPVPTGVPGELLIGGPELARGYLGRPGATAERFVPDPFGPAGGRLYRTGDLVRWLPDGALEFVGRVDDQVKIRGFRVEPAGVEAVLARCPGVDAAAVAVRPDGQGGQSLVGYVVSAAEPDVAALREWCARELPHYEVPSRFVALPALPVNAAGKLDRAALPAPDGDGSLATGAAYTEPRDATERMVAEIWGEVLGVDRIGIDDGFFDLGGHSLLATMAVSRIAERLGREVELRTLFEHPRIREFGPLVRAAREVAGEGVVPVDRSGALPMSFAQERLWFLDSMSDRGEDYLLWFSWRVRGALDRAAWQGALDDVVARHEVLRTALSEVGGRPVQRVLSDVRVPVEWHEAAAGGAEADRLAEVRERAEELATRRFDLARPPMVRSGGWRLGPDDQVVVVAFHHVATDGWSKGVFVGELMEYYRGRVAGRPVELPELPVQYGDFAVWQRERMSGGLLERQLGYWREALASLPVLELPTDRQRPAVRSGRGGVVEVELAPELLGGIDALARSCGATRFMVLLAAFQVVLARWSGQRDIAVGTPVAGRDRVEVERLVGFFVNTLVLRGDLSGEPSFTEFVGRIREVVLGAFGHQDVPFERLVEELRPERDLSRGPLFQVMFDVQETDAVVPSAAGLDFGTFVLPWSSAKFDLTANFAVRPGRFALDVEYSTDLFEEDAVRRLARHIGRVLEAVVADASVTVGRLDLMSPGERDRLLELAGDGGTAGPAVPAVVCGAEDDVALVCEDRRVTYGELDGLAGGLAVLLESRGVRSGSVVGVCVGRGVWSVAAMLAVWRCGAVYVPMDAEFPADRLAYMVAEAAVGWVVADAATEDLVTGTGARAVSVAEVTPVRGVPLVEHREGDLAYVIFTSGSSGRPKAVGVEHGPLARHVTATRRRFALSAADRVMAFASFSFDASLEQVLPTLCAGGRVVVRPDVLWTVEELAARVRAEGVTVMELVPSYWEELVARLGDLAGDLRCLRLLVSGAEALPAAPLRQWFEHLPHVGIDNTYGATELAISAGSYLATGPLAGRVPVGRPWGDRRAYVVDEWDELVPVGVPGQLLMGGPELARGYLGRPARTAERFVPDPFGGTGGRLYRTGDLVRWRTDGDLECLGRVDSQVKIRGFRIELGEIESVLKEHAAVRGAAVLVRELRGERTLVAYVAADGPDADEMAAWCGRFLPDYMVPRAFVLLAAIPLTVQGKLDVDALPEPEAPAPTGFVPPGTPTEMVTAEIWAEVLGVEQVGLYDDFFALGGHSMRAVSAVSRLRATFDCPVQVRHLFDNPTVASLSAEVERQLVEQIAAMSDEEIDLSLTADHWN